MILDALASVKLERSVPISEIHQLSCICNELVSRAEINIVALEIRRRSDGFGIQEMLRYATGWSVQRCLYIPQKRRMEGLSRQVHQPSFSELRVTLYPYIAN